MKEITRIEVGQVGVKPGTVKMITSDNLSTITTAGYLTQASVVGGISQNDIIQAIYSFDGTSGTFGLFTVSISDGVITLAQAALVADGSITTAKLANNAVTNAKMADDAVDTAEIKNSAVTTAKILDSNVTTAKIADLNVTLAKLAAAIAPSHVTKFAGKANNGGGSATITISSLTGVVATDLGFASVQASTNAVSVQKVTCGTDQLVVLLSGDPGAATVIQYNIMRAVS